MSMRLITIILLFGGVVVVVVAAAAVVVEFGSIRRVQTHTWRQSTGVKINLVASRFEPSRRAETSRNPRDAPVPSLGA